jgi:hypothetical protein
LRNNKVFMIEMIQLDVQALQYASKERKGDLELWTAVIADDWRKLEFASQQAKRNRSIVMAAVQQSGRALEWASDEVKGDEDIVKAAVRTRSKYAADVTSDAPPKHHKSEPTIQDASPEEQTMKIRLMDAAMGTNSALLHERFAKVTIKQTHHLFYLGAHDLSEMQLKIVKDNENYIFYIIRGLARFTHYHVRRFYKQRWESYSEDFKKHRIRFLSVCETTIEQLCGDSSAHTEELFTRLYAGSALLPPGDYDSRWWTPFLYQYNLPVDGHRTLARRSLALLLPHSIAWSSTEHK